MSFTKIDLEKIKNNILLSSEFQKKTKLIKKGQDYWCCCLFHKEKTASCKISDDQNSYYCFGCGARGDIFNLYTDLYNYTFQDAVKELANIAGIQLKITNIKKNKHEKKIQEILNVTCKWYQNNLNKNGSSKCSKYLESRKISNESIANFKLGYSFNSKINLYDYLKEKNYSDEEILKSNVVKLDKNKKIRDYFYKRLIFPIADQNDNIVGFGGRTLEDNMPKYLNSPESYFFKKRNLLYNLNQAKNIARKKNNLLICEGYMDVISLHQRGIKSVVSPLGTALTEDQLNLAWKYTSRPTIMFDGDKAGLRASFKSALMSLPLITSSKFLQFIKFPEGYDPDGFINRFSFQKFLDEIKKTISLANFIFNESSKTVSFENVDSRIAFDKYLEDLSKNINDNKIKYFYKNEFKSLFFDKIKKEKNHKKNKTKISKKPDSSLNQKQILSFIACSINHKLVRKEIIDRLLGSSLFEESYRSLLQKMKKNENLDKDPDEILAIFDKSEYKKILNESLNSSIYQLFPYASAKYDDNKSLEEISESCKNLNTRLLNLEKINKSLNKFAKEANELNWEELQSINLELLENE